MQTILCFGDSNTYGLNPRDKSRFDYNTRWTGILDRKLRPFGFRTAEEGLCGRTTIFSDKTRPGRKGTDMLPVLLETHAPSAVVVLMLGTNDCKTDFNAAPELIGNGIKKLISQIRLSGNSKILLVSPIHLAEGVGEAGFDPEFNEESVILSKQLKKVYSDIAQEENCLFLAASDKAEPSEADREHMDETGHYALAQAVFDMIYKNVIL